MDPLDRLWADYQADPSEEHRNALVVHYQPLVKFVASRTAGGGNQQTDREDLVSYGMFGLIDAIERFDQSRGYKFETYAIDRIKGAILDELRSNDWVPRSVRNRARQIEAARTRLEAGLHRSATAREIASELGVTDGQYVEMINQIVRGGVTAIGDSDDPADERVSSTAGLEISELREAVVRAASLLSERETIVLILYYHEGMTTEELATVLGVTASRVSQMRSETLMKMRLSLGS